MIRSLTGARTSSGRVTPTESAHCWERATPVALMASVIHEDAPLEWRAPSKDEENERTRSG